MDFSTFTHLHPLSGPSVRPMVVLSPKRHVCKQKCMHFLHAFHIHSVPPKSFIFWTKILKCWYHQPFPDFEDIPDEDLGMLVPIDGVWLCLRCILDYAGEAAQQRYCGCPSAFVTAAMCANRSWLSYGGGGKRTVVQMNETRGVLFSKKMHAYFFWHVFDHGQFFVSSCAPLIFMNAKTKSRSSA